MTMEQLFIRLLYEDWDERKYRFHLLEKDDEKNAQKGNREWFHDLELYCAAYEQREISHEEVYLENTKTLLVGHVLINTYLREHPDSFHAEQNSYAQRGFIFQIRKRSSGKTNILSGKK